MVTEKYLQLPGGVTVTIKPQQTTTAAKSTYSLPNIHGDTLATTDGTGTNTSTGNGPASTFTYDPFGNILTGSTLPSTNTSTGASFGYVGQHEKITEANYALTPIQMGARLYIPALGRFTSVDPVQGGTDNNYVYVTDPVNDFDLTGSLSWKGVANTASWASMLPGPAGMVASGVAAASYAAAGDKRQALIACAGIAAAAVGAGVALKAGQIARSAAAVEKAASVANKTKALEVTHYIGVHAAKQMEVRGVTEAMVAKAVQKGVKFNDRNHPDTIAHVLKGGMASGKTLYVAQNRYTKKITTVIIKSKFKPGKRWY